MTRWLGAVCGGLLIVVLGWTYLASGPFAPRPAAAIDSRPNRPDAPYWPQWRGPNRDDISPDTGLLHEWPEGGPPLAWKHEGLGAGFSSVTIDRGRIFTMGDRDDAQWVIALALDDGAELWRTRIGEPWDPTGYSGPRCSPTIDGDRVYALGPHGDLVCLRVADGEEVWHKNLIQDFGGKVHSVWGYSESPLVDGDKLVCTPGGPEAGIVALDKKTAEEIWRVAIPPLGERGSNGAGYSSIVISHGAGVKQYVQLVGRGVVGIAAESGKFLWGYNAVANATANIPTPLVHENYVFCSTGSGAGAALLELKPADDGGVRADQVYFLEGKELQNHHGGMVMLGDYVYLGHGHNKCDPTCLEWKTGKVVWRKHPGAGSGTGHLTYADGDLYLRYEKGPMTLVTATPKEYEERGSFRVPGSDKPSWPHPVVTGGKLYLRDQDTLFVYDVRKKG
ncbi:MAG TPA: PQQ-binding-like beta-propeller repeat protein [Pirellulales bacterium]|nr:PQQ-binding-like beta-propeller repeat protein [Pirellulales bacterium]